MWSALLAQFALPEHMRMPLTQPFQHPSKNGQWAVACDYSCMACTVKSLKNPVTNGRAVESDASFVSCFHCIWGSFATNR